MQQAEEFEESKPKKIFIVILAIFLILLTVSYLLTNSTVRSVLTGLIESSKLKESQLKTRDDIIISFSSEVLEKLNLLHNQNKGQEFKACLSGTVDGKEYTINSIYEPVIFFQNHASKKH